MPGFTPRVAILPSHVAPEFGKSLPQYADLIARLGAEPLTVAIPDELARLVPDFEWGIPGAGPTLHEVQQLRQGLIGAHAILIANLAPQEEEFEGGATGTLHYSVSDRITPVVAPLARSGIPVALTYAPKHEGGDDYCHRLQVRMDIIEGLGFTVVGEDLAGLPEFLAERASPDRFVQELPVGN